MHRKAPVPPVPQHQPLLSGLRRAAGTPRFCAGAESLWGLEAPEDSSADQSPPPCHGTREDNRSCHQPSPGQPEHARRDQVLPYQQRHPVVVECGGLLRKERNSAREEEEREDTCTENRAPVIPALPRRSRHTASGETQQQVQGWFK